MKLSTLRTLIDAGLTDQQIMNVIGTGKAPDDAPGKKEETPDVQKQILDAITGLTETIQASNLAGAKNKEPETIDDILESLIEPD